MKRSILKRITRRVMVVSGAIAYAVTMLLTYKWAVSPVYAYMGMIDRHPSVKSIIVSIAIGTLPSLWLRAGIKRPSDLAVTIFYMLAYVPSCVLPLLAIEVGEVDIIKIQLVLLLSFSVACTLARVPLVGIPRPRVNGWALLVGVSAVCYFYIALKFGLRIRMVSLADVYTVRLAFREAALESGRLAAYVVVWAANVLNPMLFIVGIVRGHKSAVVAGLFGQVVIYSLTGFKTVLFSAAILLGCYLALRWWPERFSAKALWLASVAFIAGATFKTTIALLLFRIQIIGVAFGWYFEFFRSHPKAMLGDSLVGFLSDYPYEVGVPHVIGTVYLGQVEASANAHVFADAFANFGEVGMVVVAALIGGGLWLYDSFFAGFDRKSAALLLVIPSISISNVSLQTALLTHGLVLLMLFAYLMPAEFAREGKR